MKRIILKLSGEVLSTNGSGSYDTSKVLSLAGELKKIQAFGVELGIVLGGGNIFRYRMVKDSGVERLYADYAGILAGVMNGL